MTALRLVEHDPSWPRRFQEEKARVLALLGPRLARVDHVGSTAIPRLEARPIIDLLGGLRAPSDLDGASDILARLGYREAPVFDADSQIHAFERSRADGEASHRLLLCDRTTNAFSRILLFREWLRADALETLRFQSVKRRLVETCGGDPAAYFAGKQAFAAQALSALESG
jgi:GrpB-like predicted nucleotidyltransferase (UPF0157 family)